MTTIKCDEDPAAFWKAAKQLRSKDSSPFPAFLEKDDKGVATSRKDIKGVIETYFRDISHNRDKEAGHFAELTSGYKDGAKERPPTVNQEQTSIHDFTIEELTKAI